jgi:hypothetical protein
MTVIQIADLNFGTTVSNVIVAAANRQVKAIPYLPFNLEPNAAGPVWNVEGTGITTATHAAGSAFTTPSADTTAQASLAFGLYETPIQITDEALSNALYTSNPFYGNELVRQIKKGVLQHMKKLEHDFFQGSGSNSLIGLGTAIDDTVSYAGIAHTQAYWQSVVDAGSGSTRALTRELLRSFIFKVAENSSVGIQDLVCFAPYSVYSKILGLFIDTNTLVYQQPANSFGGFNVGQGAESGVKIEGVVIQPVFDTDGYSSAQNGTLYCIDKNTVSFQCLPYVNDPTKVILDGLPMGLQVVYDPTGGHSTRVVLRNRLQVKVANPQACGKMTNIQTL